MAMVVAFFVAMHAPAGFIGATAEELDEEGPILAVDTPGSTVAILLALQDGAGGEKTLRKWSSYIDSAISARVPSNDIPSVWVLSSDSGLAGLAEELPNVDRLEFAPEQSWAETLEDFASQNDGAEVFGLLGEGVLPHPHLCVAVWSLHSALARRSDAPPRVILARSRAQNEDAEENSGDDSKGAESRGGGGGHSLVAGG